MAPLCFVTGATGFLGRELVPRLAASGRRLRLLTRPGQEIARFAKFAPEIVTGRLDDESALREGLRGVDEVVHLAALVSFRPEDRDAMFAVNADGSERLARLAREADVRRFLHTSTISAVGYSDSPTVLDERTPYNFGPLDIGYSDSKHAAERRVLAVAREGLDVVIVNPPSMYGAGDRRKGDDSLLTAVLTGRVRLAPPGGTNVAAVHDVGDGMVRALERGRTGERYLLCGENLTGRELLQRIAEVVGGRAPRRTIGRTPVLLAARALRLRERLFGSRAPITSQILQISARYMWFSSEKAARELDWRAGPVTPGIEAAWAELRCAR